MRTSLNLSMSRRLLQHVGHSSPSSRNGLFSISSSPSTTSSLLMIRSAYSSNPQSTTPSGRGQFDDEEFTPLDIVKSRLNQRGGPRKRREYKAIPPPRYLKMPVDQDWGSVWPVARSFHPATVPLPLHQGYVPPQTAPPNKWGNAELMKIPNFLHLTPPVIKRQCEALKKFCTPWPQDLKDKAVLEELFPIEIITNDYCHSLPTIRDFRSRIVTLQIRLSVLNFDYHARDKFLRLVGNRYDQKTDVVTITVENCPLRKQNYDYAMYLLTALYHESLNKEKWEDDKSVEDMEKYIWDGSASQKTLSTILGLNHKEGEPFTLTPSVEQYKDAVTNLHNDGEDLAAVEKYGKSVREILNLPSPPTQ